MNFSILKSLLAENNPHLSHYLLSEIDSTSRFLKEKYKKEQPETSICFALNQTAGYGQRGRTWFSDKEAWTFSLCVPVKLSIHKCSGLSSVVGLAIIEALQTAILDDLIIKWPNDIWNGTGKVGGVLIESIKLEENHVWFVIGIGVNIANNLKQSLPAGKDYEFSSIQLNNVSQEQLLIAVLENIFDYIQNFERNSFQYFMESFKKLDKFKDGQSVIVYDSGTPIKGVYRGVNKRGEVEIELGGIIKTYCSGSVSIRPN